MKTFSFANLFIYTYYTNSQQFNFIDDLNKSLIVNLVNNIIL